MNLRARNMPRTRVLPVLVLDANCRAGLAFIRSLGRAGVTVVGGECHAGATGFYSRFCSRSFLYRSPLADRQGFVEDVLAELKRTRYAALFAMTDQTILSLVERREEILSLVASPLPARERLEGAFDKKRTLEVAMSLGIQVPATIELRSPEEAEEAAARLGYPVVLKTRRSTSWHGDEGAKRKPTYAFDRDMLREHVRILAENGSLPLLQEFVPGKERGFAAFVHRGRQMATFEIERLRSTHPLGSGSWCCSRAAAHDPYVKWAAQALIEALDWEGFALVEFKIHERTGKAYLLEINGRPWASLHLALKAGVDFPLLAYRALTRQWMPIVPANYAVGTECRWLRGELMYLRHILGGVPAASAVAYPRRVRGTLEVLGPGMLFGAEEFMCADPAPGLVAVGRHLFSGVRRVWGRLLEPARWSREMRRALGLAAALVWLAWAVAVYGRYLFGYRQVIKRAVGLLVG